MLSKRSKILATAAITLYLFTGCEMTCESKKEPETPGEHVGKVIDNAIGHDHDDGAKVKVKIKEKDKD